MTHDPSNPQTDLSPASACRNSKKLPRRGEPLINSDTIVRCPYPLHLWSDAAVKLFVKYDVEFTRIGYRETEFEKTSFAAWQATGSDNYDPAFVARAAMSVPMRSWKSIVTVLAAMKGIFKQSASGFSSEVLLVFARCTRMLAEIRARSKEITRWILATRKVLESSIYGPFITLAVKTEIGLALGSTGQHLESFHMFYGAVRMCDALPPDSYYAYLCKFFKLKTLGDAIRVRKLLYSTGAPSESLPTFDELKQQFDREIAAHDADWSVNEHPYAFHFHVAKCRMMQLSGESSKSVSRMISSPEIRDKDVIQRLVFHGFPRQTEAQHETRV